nr:MAG TPA: hypothetical protein [Caudoviricetes sp.]
MPNFCRQKAIYIIRKLDTFVKKTPLFNQYISSIGLLRLILLKVFENTKSGL